MRYIWGYNPRNPVILRISQHAPPGTYQDDPQPTQPVKGGLGMPGDAWGMLQWYVGVLLES